MSLFPSTEGFLIIAASEGASGPIGPPGPEGPPGPGAESIVDFLDTMDFPTVAAALAGMQSTLNIPDGTFQLAYTVAGANIVSEVTYTLGVGVQGPLVMPVPESVRNVNEGALYLNDSSVWTLNTIGSSKEIIANTRNFGNVDADDSPTILIGELTGTPLGLVSMTYSMDGGFIGPAGLVLRKKVFEDSVSVTQPLQDGDEYWVQVLDQNFIKAVKVRFDFDATGITLTALEARNLSVGATPGDYSQDFNDDLTGTVLSNVASSPIASGYMVLSITLEYEVLGWDATNLVIANVDEPTSPLQAANKDYVDQFPVWNPTRTYRDGQIVEGSDGENYSSLVSDNLDNDPVTAPPLSMAVFSGDSFSVTAQDISPFGLHLSEDGLIMFVVGLSNDNVYRYDLSIPFDITTAIFVSEFPVGGVDTNPIDLFLSPDGRIMFILGNITDEVHRFNLSIPFDITTAVLLNDFNVGAQDPAPQGIHFSSDGELMFMVGPLGSNSVYKYNLTTGFDLTTASFSGDSFSITPQDGSPTDVFVSSNGRTMFVSGDGTNAIYGYILATPFLLSSAVLRGTFAVGSEDSSPNSVVFSPDGLIMFMLGNGSNSVYKYDLTKVWSKILNEESEIIFPSSWDSLRTYIDGEVVIGPDNENYSSLILGNVGNKPGTAFASIVTAVPTGDSLLVGPQDVSPTGIHFSPDGLIMFMAGNATDRLYRYDLTIPFDLSTGSSTDSLIVAAQDFSPQDVFLTSDGLIMFMLGSTNGSVYRYDLSPAFDLSSASFVNSFVVGGQDTAPAGIHFSPEGSMLFMMGDNTNAAYRYDLSIPFNVTTAVYSGNTFNVSGEDGSPQDIFLSPNGRLMHMIGADTDKVFSYNLSPAFDLETATLANEFLVIMQDPLPRGLDFSPDGTTMFVLGDVNNRIFSYDLFLTWTKILNEESEIISPNNWDASRTYIEGEIVIGPDHENYSSLIENNIGKEPGKAFGTISTAVFSGDSFSIAAQDASPRGLQFSEDGLSMFLLGFANDAVFKYTLTVPFDLTSATYSGDSFNVLAQDNSMHDIFLTPDGLIMFTVGVANTSVYRYDLSPAFDITSASFLNSFDYVAQDSAMVGIHFSSDGLKMILSGGNTDTIYRYNLTTPYDLTTVSFASDSFLVSGEDTSAQDVFLSSDGLTMFVAGASSDRILSYSLSSPFILATAVLTDALPIAAQDTFPRGIDFSPDGTLFMLGDTTDSIYSYNLPIVWAKIINEENVSLEILHGEFHQEDNAVAYILSTANQVHSYHSASLIAGDLEGMLFDSGMNGGAAIPIAAIGDAGGGDILVTTSSPHGLDINSIISQTVLADAAYVGVFKVITVPSPTTYTVTAAFTATGTGTMNEAATLTILNGAAGVYAIDYSFSANPAVPNDSFDFEIFNDGVKILGTKRTIKFGPAGDFRVIAGSGIDTFLVGAKVSFILENQNTTANLTIEDLSVRLIRLKIGNN
jgi:sugar lactone lactonase YvrE